MKQKRHMVDQIISQVPRADVLLGAGSQVPKVSKRLEITEQNHYRVSGLRHHTTIFFSGRWPDLRRDLAILKLDNLLSSNEGVAFSAINH